jgi:hypothetical protein
MTTEKIESTRGAVLLGELKELVNSFPAHQQAEVIALFRRIFRLLNGRVEFVCQDNETEKEESA